MQGFRSSISEDGGTHCSRPYCLEPGIDDDMPSPQLVDFFEAWNKSGNRLETFKCSSGTLFLPALQRSFTPSALDIFRHTREISIVYGSEVIEIVPTKGQSEAYAIQTGQISTLLSAASSLKHISISGAINVSFSPEFITLYPILGTTSWANLQSLCLATIDLQFQELEALCERQRDTLKALMIQRSGLSGGTWAGALPVIRTIQNLRHVMLAFLWHGKDARHLVVDDESREAVQRYVLEGGPNPLDIPQSPSS